MAHYEKSLISIFQVFFARIDKISNVKFEKLKDKESIFNRIYNNIADEIENTFYQIRIILKTLERSILKRSLLKFY